MTTTIAVRRRMISWPGLGDIGRVMGTHHPELRLWHAGTHLWRILRTNDHGNTCITGPKYKTSGDALNDLDQIHRDGKWRP